MKVDEIKGDVLEHPWKILQRDFFTWTILDISETFHLDDDYKSPWVQSKYVKQLKAILWVGGFYMTMLAHDDWSGQPFLLQVSDSSQFAAVLGSLSSSL